MRTLVATGVPPPQAAGLAALTASDPAHHAAADSLISPELLIRAAVSGDTPLLLLHARRRLGPPGSSPPGRGSPCPRSGDQQQSTGRRRARLLSSRALRIAAHHPARDHHPGTACRWPVVQACAGEEQHVVQVYALHAVLAGQGVDVRQLGGRASRQALGPRGLRPRPTTRCCVWSRYPEARAARLYGQPACGAMRHREQAGSGRRPGGRGPRRTWAPLQEAATELAARAFTPMG